MGNAKVSSSELQDPDQARLVAQCDITDGIGKIINFEFSDELGASIPVLRVNGEDKGIQHSFRIQTDQFAQGDKKLVNFKRYYFMAIAYAHNNFKDYSPNDPLSLDGQKKRYIASRKAAVGEVKPIEVIPHNPMPEAGGTAQLISYGSSPRITRLDGYGNGNRSLELTQASMNEILTTGYMASPTYDYGAGPVNIKVVDPLNLANGYFTCKFRNYTAPTIGNAADTASWVIYRHVSKEDMTILDSVSSERTIKSDNEQIIPQWGVSVQIFQNKYIGTGNLASKSTNMIDASVDFADSSKRWLTGVQDNDAFFPTNWIRSGDYSPECDPGDPAFEGLPDGPTYLNPCNYPDEAGADPTQGYERVLEGVIAPHRLVGYQADYMPLAYFGTFSGSSKLNASISFLPSVNIVLTSDKSLWTRCPIVELGRNPSLNVGNAQPGALRKSQSVNKNGQPDGTGTGMGWFPGYAVDLESGARLYMAFGENSFLGGENGADMIWNPTDRLVSSVGTPLMGGMHPVYVFSYNQASTNGFSSGFNFPAYVPAQAENNNDNFVYNKYLEVEGNSSSAKRELYGSLTWVAYPMLAPDQELLATDVTIRLRVNKEYKNFNATGANGGKPMYGWSMEDIATKLGSQDMLKEALAMINVVPNPYYAFSEYERNKLDNRVKITNLPEQCQIRIYSSNGKLIRRIKKDSPQTFQDWDLTNHAGIPVASGIYLIHVEVPNVGERVLKAFIAMRMVDLQNI